MKNSSQLLKHFILLSLVLSFAFGCTYFRRETAYKQQNHYPNKVDKVMNKVKKSYNRYIYIVHVADTQWQMTNVVNSGDLITGTINTVSPDNMFYYKNIDRKRNKIIRVTKYTRGNLYQVHIHASKLESIGMNVSLSKDDIYKIDLYQKDQFTTSMSYLGTATLSTVGGIGVILAVVCSACPHVYVVNSDTYQFANGLYVGAISEQLERFDHKLLPDIDPGSNEINVIIKNEEDEVQYTNLLDLTVVEHNLGERAVPDQDGEIHLFKEKIACSSVKNDDGQVSDIQFAGIDENIYSFSSIGQNNYSNLYLTFPTAKMEGKSSLILSLANHPWGGFVYEEFSKMFGSYHDNWVKKNGKKSPEKMLEDIKRQGIPMVVSIETENGWEEIETVNLVGSRILNTVALPLDPRFLNGEEIKIRLQTGFMFWKLDEAIIGTNEASAVVVHNIKPKMKFGKDLNWETALASNDDNYMVHHEGDSILLSFDGVPVVQEKERTLILNSKGYYLKSNKYKGVPEIHALKNLDQPGGLSVLSHSLYQDLLEKVFVQKD